MRPIAILLITTVSALMAISCAGSPEKPNIVVFLADDLGYGDLGCYGCDDIRTPHIDKMAAMGVRFTRFYSNAPECTPTRTAFMTGRYQQRIGGLECAIGAGNVGRYDHAMWLSERKSLGLPSDESTLMHVLKANGYQTALLGKWHLGYDREFRPDRHGLDYSLCLLGGLGDYFYHVEQVEHDLEDFAPSHTLSENGSEVFYNGEYLTHLATRKSLEWLDRRDREQPFFLFLPYTAPHLPYQGPGDDLGRPIRAEEDMGSRSTYGEMVESMDQGIGEIIAYLRSEGLMKETLIIFFSDNGGTTHADNGICRGGKGTVFEGGIRVPCIVQWSGQMPENTISEQTSISFDLTKSIIELVDGECETGLDGYHILDHVMENRAKIPRTMAWRTRRGNITQKAILEGDYKYLLRMDSSKVLHEGLFHLESDPSEALNLLTDSIERLAHMKSILHEWEADVRAPRLQDFSLE